MQWQFHEGESVNKSQMDIKHVIFEPGKNVFLDISSTNIDTLIPSLYQCVDTCSIEVFSLLSRPFPHLRFNLFVSAKHLSQSCERLYATNTSHGKHEIFLYEYPLHWVLLSIKTHNRTLLFGSILKYGRHFDYWNKPLNMRMRVYYLDCHKAGLCYYLVIHIENLLHPLHLFYFHLWPIYWLALVRGCQIISDRKEKQNEMEPNPDIYFWFLQENTSQTEYV
jgi:hypothetical protein